MKIRRAGVLNKIEARILDRLINGVKVDKKQLLVRDPNGSRWLQRSLFPRAIAAKRGEIGKALKSVKEQGLVKSKAKDSLKQGPTAEFFCITEEGITAYSRYQNTLFIG